MATTAPVASWSAELALTASTSYTYTATPGAGGYLRMQYSLNGVWVDFANNFITAAVTARVPAGAVALRGQGYGSAGSFDATALPTADDLPANWSDSTGTALVRPDGSYAPVDKTYAPEQFGSVGTADDAAAVILALRAAEAAGGLLKFTAGKTYTFRNLQILASVTIDARGANINYGGSNGTVAPLEVVPVILYADGSSGAPIRNVSIIGGKWTGARTGSSYANNNANAEDLMQFNYCPGLVITGAEFRDCQQDAITLAYCTGARIVGNRAYDIADGFIEFRQGGQYVAEGNYGERVRHMVVCKPNIAGACVVGNVGSTFREGIIAHGTDWTISNNVLDVVTVADGQSGADRAGIEVSDYGGLFTATAASRIHISGNTIKGRSGAQGIMVQTINTAFTLTGLVIDGNAIDAGVGIKLDTGACVVSNNSVIASTGSAIEANASALTALTISGNNLSSSQNTATVGVIGCACPGAKIVGNEVNATAGGQGIRITSAATGAAVDGNRVTTSSANAIYTFAPRTKVTGNEVTASASAGISINGAGSVVAGNSINCASGEAIYCYGANTTVSGNVATGGTHGVRVGANDCVLTGNRFTGMQFYGVNVMAGAADTIVVSNNLKGNTSGAYTDAGTTTLLANNRP